MTNGNVLIFSFAVHVAEFSYFSFGQRHCLRKEAVLEKLILLEKSISPVLILKFHVLFKALCCFCLFEESAL